MLARRRPRVWFGRLSSVLDFFPSLLSLVLLLLRRYMAAGDHRFVFLRRGPLYLAAIDAVSPTVEHIRVALMLVHRQVRGKQSRPPPSSFSSSGYCRSTALFSLSLLSLHKYRYIFRDLSLIHVSVYMYVHACWLRASLLKTRRVVECQLSLLFFSLRFLSLTDLSNRRAGVPSSSMQSLCGDALVSMFHIFARLC